MKPHDFESTSQPGISDLALMRLVDGELSDVERRELLLQIEAVPTRWRECALAFLEDQALRQQLSTRLVNSQPFATSVSPSREDDSFHQENAPSSIPEPNSQHSRPFAMPWSKAVALAATILLAFYLGQYQAGQGPVDSLSRPEANHSSSSTKVANSLPTEWHDATNSFSQPIYVSNSDFWDRDSALPDELQRSLEQMGAEVRRQRGLMPMRLLDGRYVTVPYEDVQLVPVRGTSY